MIRKKVHFRRLREMDFFVQLACIRKKLPAAGSIGKEFYIMQISMETFRMSVCLERYVGAEDSRILRFSGIRCFVYR